MTARQRLLGAESAALKERIAFVALLVATALVNTVNLAQNGWANAFYSAAAQAGSSNGEAFLFGSSDAANSITVDKPPMSLWFMDVWVRLFGLSPLSILLPEALMGVATVVVLYLTVRRAFSWQTALLAGGVLALTPVVALMFRYNNPDALLTLLMSLALYFTLRGIESGRLRWLLLAGAMVGFGFLTKQLQAFLILPALAGIYLVAAPGTWWRRIWHLLAALGAVIVSAGWWVAIVTLTPPDARPYIGGSQTNSFLELTFGYNGLGRIDGSETGSVTNGTGSPWGNPGIARLFQGDIGGQIAWLIPGTMLLTVVAFLLVRGSRSEPRRTVLMLLTADFLVTGLTFSFAAGIFHQYYTVALAPPLAGMFAIGASIVWTNRGERWVRLVAAGAIVATLIWTYALLGESADFLPGLAWLVVAVSIVAITLVVVLPENRIGRACTIFVVLLACLLGPTVWTLETIVTQHTGAIPTAGPLTVDTTSSQVGGNQAGIRSLLGAPDVTRAERSLLLENASRYTWVAAAVGSNTAAGYQLATLKPVMPIGGFNGSDPSPTLRQFKADVAAGRIHYFVGGLIGPSNGGSSIAEAIDHWVKAHYRAIRLDGSTFYDLTR